MDRTRSLNRRAAVFGAAAVLSLAILLFRSPLSVESTTTERLPAALPTIEMDKIRAFEIHKTVVKDDKPVPETLRLERTGLSMWIVASASGYPADGKKIEDTLRSLASVKSKSVSTTNPAKFPSFAEKEGFTEVRVFGEAGRDEEPPLLVSFGVGKTGAGGSYADVFLRVDDVGKGGLPAPGARPPPPAMEDAAAATPALPGKIVVSSGLDSYGLRTDVTSWIETRLFPGLSESDISEISWSHAAKSFAGTLVRGTKGEKDTEDPWTLSDPAPGAAAKRDGAKQVVQALVGLRLAALEGPAPADADAKFGFDKPDVVVTAKGKPVKEGAPARSWKIEIGKKIEGKSSLYARRATAGAEDKWVFTVEEYEITRFREDPKDLLEKKPEPPPEPAMAEPAMGDAAMADGPAMGEGPAMGDAPPPASPADGPAMGDAPPPAPPAMAEGPAMDDAPPPAPPAMSDGPAMGDASPPAPPAMGEKPPAPPAMGEPAPAR